MNTDGRNGPLRMDDPRIVLLDLLVPPVCIGCSVLLGTPSATLCLGCRTATNWLRAYDRYRDGIEAILPYEGPWAAALHQLKYHQQLDRAAALGRALATAKAFEADWDWVIPIPLHRRKQWARGFNQSVLITDLALREPGLARLRPRLAPGLLRRIVAGQSQTHLRAPDRETAVQGTFAVPLRRRARIEGRRILVVDDVTTTGATVRAARQALDLAGARWVGAVALLRTL